jgi:hypothetical protein
MSYLRPDAGWTMVVRKFVLTVSRSGLPAVETRPGPIGFLEFSARIDHQVPVLMILGNTNAVVSVF